MNSLRSGRFRWALLALSLILGVAGRADAQTTPTASLVDPNRAERTAVTGLSQPVNLAFIGKNDMLVLEKGTGRVQRIVNGVLHSTVLDLAVNSASERGLLGIALHPRFKKSGYVYLFWSESSTGTDTTDLASVPLLGNRVDGFVWNGSALTHDLNLIRLRAFQADDGQPLRGNHDGGVMIFGPERGHRDDDDDHHHRGRHHDGDDHDGERRSTLHRPHAADPAAVLGRPRPEVGASPHCSPQWR